MLPGGVCAVLDYEMDQMTDYVAEMTQRLLMPELPVAPAFRKFVAGLLSSTRLPSTTILLGLNYLAKRINQSYPTNLHLKSVDAGQTWRFLTIGLLMGSKFLDDNTFQNRSWSEVSSIPVAELNRLEYEWLSVIEWDMYVNLDADRGYNAWLDSWDDWRKARNKERAVTLERLAPLPPINTNVPTYARDSLYAHPYSGYVRSAVHDQLPSFRAASFEPWNQLPTPQLTPPSAPGSGLNTPEYLSATGGGPRYDWTLFNAPTSQSAITYPRYQTAQLPNQFLASRVMSHHQPYTAYPSSYGHYGTDIWNTPVSECGCQMCLPQPKQPYLTSHYGVQPMVAG